MMGISRGCSGLRRDPARGRPAAGPVESAPASPGAFGADMMCEGSCWLRRLYSTQMAMRDEGFRDRSKAV